MSAGPLDNGVVPHPDRQLLGQGADQQPDGNLEFAPLADPGDGDDLMDRDVGTAEHGKVDLLGPAAQALPGLRQVFFGDGNGMLDFLVANGSLQRGRFGGDALDVIHGHTA